MNFSERVALITGAGSPQGIGFAAAQLLARQGAKIALTSTTDRIHDRVHDLGVHHAHAFGVAADLSDHEQSRALVQQVLDRFGRIDILVNNAGMTQSGRPAETATLPLVELSEKDWDYSIAINLKTVFNVTKAVLPAMLVAGYGRVVNVSSTTGPISSNPRETAYSAAKANGGNDAQPGTGGCAQRNNCKRSCAGLD